MVSMSKTVFVRDLPGKLGENLTEVFALARVSERTTKTGKPYKSLVLRDKTGAITGIVWENFLDVAGSLKPGSIGEFEFAVEEYRGMPNLKITAARQVENYEAADFVATSPRDLTEMEQELSKRIDSVRDYQLRQLLNVFFENEKFYGEFIRAPAAKVVHHAYQHGLLEHTLEVLTLLDPLFHLYPQLNKDLVTTAVLLHDIGKIYEYATDTVGQIERTTDGRLLGHIYLSAQMIGQRFPKDFPKEIRRQLLHIVLSHQGKLEYGSPVVPATREAIAIFHADHLSSELNIAQGEVNGVVNGVADSTDLPLFSEYNKYLGTQIYVEREN